MTIPKPSVEQVEIYLERWKGLEDYPKYECFLKELFTKYRQNDNEDKVLIKVKLLDSLYNTNIGMNTTAITVARHIVDLGIDQRIENKKPDLTLVNEIAKVERKKGKSKKDTVNLFSFATKYCSFHSPENYPIYDKNVEKMLWHFKPNNNFKKKKLKCYPIFHAVLTEFIEHYKLNKFDLKQIDHYLWLAGQDL